MPSHEPKDNKLQRREVGLQRAESRQLVARDEPVSVEEADRINRLERETRRRAQYIEALGEVDNAQDMKLSMPTGERWFFKLAVCALALGVGVFAFWLLPSGQATLFLIFSVLAVPLVIGFALRGDTLGPTELVQMYQAGVRQVPLLGRLIKPTPTDSPSDT